MNSCYILLLLLLCNLGRNCNDQDYYETNRGGRNRNDGNRNRNDCGCDNDYDDDCDGQDNESRFSSRFDTRSTFGSNGETCGCEENDD